MPSVVTTFTLSVGESGPLLAPFILIETSEPAVRSSRPHPDPFVKIYDSRSLRSVASIPFPSGPAFISSLATNQSIVIASDAGLIQITDISDPDATTDTYNVLTGSFITALASSPTGDYIAAGDAEGVVHIVGSGAVPQTHERTPFNGYAGQPIDWIDIPDAAESLEWEGT